MKRIREIGGQFCREECAATMVEYAIMVALIAVVCVAAVSIVGSSTNASLSNVADKMP